MPDLELGAALNAYSESLRALDKPPEDTEAGWLDVPKEAAASIAETVAQPLGAGQVATAVSDPDVSNLLGGLSMMGHEAARGLRASQSNVARRAAEATIIPEEGKPSFFQAPIRSSAMQAAGLAGPGALLMGAAMLAPEGFLAGLITDASAGAVLGVAQTADKAAQYYNNPELTDDKLAEEDPRFRMLTEQGIDPKEARNIRMQEVVRDAPLFANGLAGALGMGVGGRVLRRTTGGTGSVLSRAVLGAGENAAGMGGMAAAGTFADQDLEIAQGKRTDYDYRKMWLAAAQGGALGAAMGTVGGVLHKSDGRRVREDNTPTVESTDSSQLDATNTVALTPETPPAPSVELSTLAAPGSKPVEPSGVKSQGVTEEEIAGLKGELPPKVEVATTAPEIPVVHPGEPETPVATAAHPDVPEVTPPEPRAVEPVAPTTTAPEQAPKPDVTQQVTTPAAPKAPAPVAEARVDPATGRRILEGPRWGEKDEGWQTMPGQTEVPRPVPTEEPGVGHSAKKVLEQQAKNHEIATRILHSQPALEPFKENTQANRESLRNRLQGQVSEALASGFGVIKKAKGSPFENRIPDRVHKQPGEVMWLADAQRMLRRLNSKKPVVLDELNKFIADENAGRSGQWDVMAARRKGEGAAFGEGKKKEAAAEAAPEEVSGGDAMDKFEGKEPSPEDIILQHEEELKQQLEARAANEPVAPVEEEPTQEAPSRERPAPKIEGEAYTVPKERAAPVTVARGRGRYEGMRPKVAEKVALSRKEPKEKLRKDTPTKIAEDAFAELREETEKAIAEYKKETGKDFADAWKEEGQTEKTVFSYNHDKGEHVREEALGVTNLKDTFKRLDATNYDYGLGKFNRALHQVFRNRVLEHVGDMKVFYVTVDQMGRLDNKKTAGYYDPNHKHIVLRVDAVGHPSDAAPIILHEALHAAYHDAIEANPDLKNEIQKMIRAVIGHIRKNELDAISKLGKRAQHDLTYGLTSPHEFISEAFTNKAFQDLLTRVRVPDEMAQRLGLKGKIISAWDWLVNEFRKHLNLPKGAHSMLEAAIKLGEHLEVSRKRVEAQRGKSLEELLDELSGLTASMPRKPLELLRRVDTTEETFRNVLARGAENAHEQLGKFASDPVNRTVELAKDIAYQPDLSKGLRAFSNIFLANHMHLQRIKHLDKELVGAVYNTIERAGTYARKLRDAVAPHIANGIRLEKKVPGLYSEAVDIMHQATRYGADPTSALGVGRNERLAVNKKVQAKLDKGAKIEDLINDVNANHIDAILAHPELARRYEALIRKEPKFERFIKDTFNYYDEVQLAQSKNIIRNALEATDKFPVRADLNKRVNELSDMVITKENTDALKQEIGEAALDHVIKGKSLVGNGPYAPLIRRGEWVVRGKYKIHAPSNALAQTGPNVYEFATKREAVDFARSTGLHAKYDTAYYDPTTGEKTTKLGGVSTAGGPEQRWVATLQHEHMEMHESIKVAQRQYEDLKKSGLFEEIHAPVAHSEYHNLSGELTHGAVGSLLRQLEKTDAYQRADSTAKAEMRNAIVAAGNIARAGNRVSSRSIPRRNVPGFSKDFTRNLVEYTTASSYERAKQVYRPQIDDMLMQLTHSVRNMADKNETDRSVELKEVINRARAPNPEEYTGKFAEIARRIGIWSYIDRMMRISHLILHQTHLPMITAPIIAGRHGVARTYATIAGAWRDAFPAMKAGGIDFKNSLYDPLIQGTDYSTFIGGLFKGAKDGAHIVDLFNKLNEDGTIHPQAGIEVHKYTPSQQLGGPLGGLDKTMSYLDTTFRHLTNATEAINRHVGAVAAYRLEFQKLRRQGLTDAVAHERAVAYASDILKNTQGLYSSTNAAPLFKVPYLRPFLQFKQFPQMMYHLMARSLLNGFKKMPEGLSQEAQKEFRMQRADALRGLTYLLTTHALATGLLGGLPTEPLKYAGAVTKALGVTSDDFTAVDRWLYDKAVANFGKEGAEWLMHGLARGLGPDVHHRMGLSSLTSWGLDKVTSAADFKGFLFDQAMGAPGSLAADTFTGVRQMADANNMGDVTAGALKAFPLQAMRDIQKAWTGKGSGKYEYSPFERGVRALGFTPVGEAEEAERKAETYKQVDQYNQERRTLMRKWADADSSDKGSAWSRIQKFNKDKPKDSQITMKQLTDAAKRRKKGEDEGDIVHGVRLNKQTRFIGERANAIYN
jgi:hypothetical protein